MEKINQPHIKVRHVLKEDFEQWLPLWDGYNKFYGRSGETALAPEITQITWERFFDPNEPVHALVAELNGKLIGLTHFLYHRSTTMVHPVCYLQDLFTLEEVRGQGVGTALIEAVYKEAKTAISQRVYWQTHESNEAAMKLYNKLAKRSGFLVYRKDI